MSAVPVPTPAAVLGGPWLGLQSYEERHCQLFFGRDDERDELFRLVERGVLTVLYGVSGLGKTSLLNAGLFPRLREAFYLPIPIRLRFGSEAPEPIVQVRQAVAGEIAARCSSDTPPPSEQQTLWEFFHCTPLWNHKVRLHTPVLVFDQFEEVLTLGAQDARTPGLLEALADLIENYIPRSVAERLEASQQGLPFSYENPKVKVIFSLREDYLAQLQDLRTLMPSLMRNSYRLKPMTGSQALEAVTKPAQQAGLEITEEVAERIVRIASGAETAKPLPLDALEVEPVLLSLFCDELNKKRVGLGVTSIGQDLVQGEHSRILSDFYTRCVANEATEVRRYIEDDLLTKEGHRDTKAVENLPQAVKEAVGRLIDLRLLRREERLGRPYVELIHDVLTEPILASRRERREREAVEEERRRQEEARSRERVELQRSREKVRILMIAAVMFLGLAGAAVMGWVKATRSEKAAKDFRVETTALKLASEARFSATAPGTFEQAVLLAIESLLKRPTPEGSFAWSEAVNRLQLPGETTLQHEGVVTAVAFSPKGKYLATASTDGTAQVWEAESGKKITQPLKHEDAVTAVAFSPDGKYLATASADGTAQVWEAESGKLVTPPLKHGGVVIAVAFSPDCKRLMTASNDGTARVWEAESGKKVTPPLKHGGVFTALAFSPDGKRLATASFDSTARVWDSESGKEVTRLAHPAQVNGVVFSPDSRRLATASADGRARVWPLEVDDMIRTACARLSRKSFSDDEWLQYLGKDEERRTTCP